MTHSWPQWRAAARIAWRDARKSKGRTVLVMILVGLPIFAGALGTTLWKASAPTPQSVTGQYLGTEAQALLQWQGAGVMQSPELGSQTAITHDESPFEVADTADIEKHLSAVVPAGNTLHRESQFVIQVATPERAVTENAVELDLAVPELAALLHIRDGALPGSTDQVAISKRLAERLNSDVGSILLLYPPAADGEAKARATTVVGIVDSAFGAGVFALPGTVVPVSDRLSDDVSRTWYVTGPAPVTWADVVAFNTAGATVMSRDALLNPPQAADTPFYQSGMAHDGGSLESVSSGTIAVVGAVVVLGLFEVILLIGPAFAVGARRNERQLALLASVGGDSKALSRVVLLGGVVSGLGASLIGAVAGILAGLGLVQSFRMRDPWAFPSNEVPLLIALVLVVVGTLIATAAAWQPARYAARIDVISALAGRRKAPPFRKRVPVIGVSLVALSFVMAVGGAVLRQPMVIVAAVGAMIIGAVICSGALIDLLALFAPRMGPIGRFTLRDATRNRSRTVPAVAAIIAAIAGVVSVSVFIESKNARDASMRIPIVAEGVVLLEVDPAEHTDVVTGAESFPASITRALESALAVTHVQPVFVAMQDPATFTPEQEADPDQQPRITYVQTLEDPDTVCPMWAEAGANEISPELRAKYGDDPRCVIQHFEVSTIMVHGVNGTIVDDGRAILATGLPGAHKAAEALAQGRAVVTGRPTVWSDGDARFVHQVWPDGEEPTAVQFPATYVDLPTGIILSLSAVESRPDMATLGAVGASPRIRRRLAGAQAGFTTGLGVLMGTALGVGFAGVLVLTFRFEFEGPPSQNWALHMPWPTLAAIVLAVPVCAALGAFILTRADLPMTRRLAS